MQKFYSLILLFIIPTSSVDALTTTDGNFDYTINSDGETVTLTGGRSRDLPASIEGMPVTIIGSRAFKDSNLWNGGQNLTIPNNVETIGSEAFYSTHIKNLQIPNSVKIIYGNAFRNCQQLETVTGGNNVEYYSSGVYFGCIRLKSLYIGQYCTYIGSQLIAVCHSLETLTVSSSNPNFSAIGTVLFNKDYTVLLEAPSTSGHYIIPDTVHTVQKYAFSNQDYNNIIVDYIGLTGITIPDSVISIGDGAFSNQNLTSVTVPSNVTSIGRYAFRSNDSLTSYTFEGINAPTLGIDALSPVGAEAEITYPYGGYGYGETFGGLPASSPYTSGTYDSFTYVINQDGTSVKITDYPNRSTELIIPSSINGREVSMIDSHAFSNCYSLTGVSIPNTVTEIGSFAFYGCYGLSTITIGNGVHSIGSYAFQGCSGLQDFIIDADNSSFQSIGAVLLNRDLTVLIAAPSISGTYEVPSGVTRIEDLAFLRNSAISSVTIASSVTSIGVSVFQGCSNLDDIKFLGVTAPSLGGDAFKAVSSGAAVTYPYGGSGYGATFGGLPANEVAGWLVSVGAASGGTTNLAPGAGFEDGTVVSITATPDLGYIFGNWSGDYSGISNPLEFTISEDTSVTPLFYPDYSDVDSDGLTAYDELITHGTNPNLPDSNGDGVKDGDAVNAALNPQTDYTDIINYVKLNSHDFDLYTQDSIMDLSLGRAMIQRNTQGGFDLSYEVQTSEDLSTWSTHSSPSVAIEPVGNKEFIRISVE